MNGTLYEKNMKKENIGRKEEKKGGRKEGRERMGEDLGNKFSNLTTSQVYSESNQRTAFPWSSSRF